MNNILGNGYFIDVVTKCQSLCMMCNILSCSKVNTVRRPILEIKLAEQVNQDALSVIKELSIQHPRALFLFTGINDFASNLPEVSTVFNVDAAELELIDEEYEEGIENYVTDYGVTYEGMSMVEPESFDLKWLSSDDLCFFVEKGQFYIQEKKVV